MGTETDIYVRPCLCGQGEFEIQRSTPDHPFASSYAPTFHGVIRCEVCKGKYAFSRDALGQDSLLLLADVLAKEEASAKWWAASKALNESSDAGAIRNQLAERLDEIKTKKATHDLLTKHGLVHGSYSNFSRKYAGGVTFARGLMVGQLGKVLDLLGSDSSSFREKLAHVESLYTAIPKPIPVSATSALWRTAT